MNPLQIPRLMIAAPKSGSGKTMVTCGLIHALRQKSCSIRAFKCGPDYIDPLYLTRASGAPSVNLDTYFTDHALTRALFASHAQNHCAVIEGVMGYFDGIGGVQEQASSADVAAAVQAPVVLLVDASDMGISVAALIKGFCECDIHHAIKGVVLNKVSKSMFVSLKNGIESLLPYTKVYGYVPKLQSQLLNSRHLGLVMPSELPDFDNRCAELAAVLGQTVDIDGLIRLAESAPPLSVDFTAAEIPQTVPLRAAVARDEAFCFYYEDNLELLRKAGCELSFFSPVNDSTVPQADILLLGGGYPELHAEQLSANVGMREAVKKLVAEGMLVLAECGGFMYLQQALVTQDNRTYEMAGALPGTSSYTGKLVRFGYADFSDGKSHIKGHEFHYFDSSDNGSDFTAVKPSGGSRWQCIVRKDMMIAGFPHLYYYSNPAFILSFLEAVRKKKVIHG